MHAALLVAVALATPALADPYKAILDRGPAPDYLKRGKTFSGPVVYVGDGDSIGVDVLRSGPGGWAEVRVADFYAPELAAPGGREAKAERIAMGRPVQCVAGKQSYDRVVATCQLNGVSLGDLMRRAGVPEGGRGR